MNDELYNKLNDEHTTLVEQKHYLELRIDTITTEIRRLERAIENELDKKYGVQKSNS